MSISIRPFSQAYQVSLIETLDSVCGEGCWMYTKRFEPTPAWTHALCVPACSSHRLLIADGGGEVVGWCRLFPIDSWCGRDPVVEVGIGVLQDYRGRGLGKLLLSQALAWAVRAGVQQAVLTTKADNARAIRLFERLGFRTNGNSADALLYMTCQLLPLGG